MPNLQNNIFVVAAASGTGKTSLLHAASKHIPNMRLSVSHTTRPPRENEVHGRDYFFTTDAEFKEMIHNKKFLEHAEVYGHYYGTSRDEYDKARSGGEILVMEIDCQGAQQVREHLGNDVTLIFILSPSKEELYERLVARGLDSPETIEKRLREADNEIAQAHLFDIRIVNTDFDTALAELVAALSPVEQT